MEQNKNKIDKLEIEMQEKDKKNWWIKYFIKKMKN